MKIIVLSNSEIDLKDLNGFEVYTLSFDRIILNKFYYELIEKYQTSISLLYNKDGIHMNTLIRVLYYLKKYDNGLYYKILPRVKIFLDIHKVKIIVYNVDNTELEILDDINIYYTLYLDYINFIYGLKKICH